LKGFVEKRNCGISGAIFKIQSNSANVQCCLGCLYYAFNGSGITRLYIGAHRQSGIIRNALDYFHILSQTHMLAVGIAERCGDTCGIAWALYCLGGVAMSQGDYEQALAFSQESLALFRQLGIKDGIALSLHTLGHVALFQGRYGPAASSFEESLVLRRELGDRVGIAHCLAGLAGVQGRAAQAARLFSATGALLDLIGASLEPVDRAAYDRHVIAVHALMAEAAFEAAWTEGQALSQEQSIAEALRLAAEHHLTDAPAGSPPVSAPSA
jgi:tetratricopeptide (TPR) repeat protein